MPGGDFRGVDRAGKPAHLESFGAVYVGLSDPAGAELQLSATSQPMQLSLQSSAPLHYDKLGVAPSLWSFDAAAGWIEDATAPLSIDGVKLDNISVGTQKKTGKGLGKKKGQGAVAWTPDAFAALFADKNGAPKALGFPLKRPGWWNVDAPYRSSLLSLRLMAAGRALPNVTVYAVGLDYKGRSTAVTSAEGLAHVRVQFSSRVRLDVQLVSANFGNDKDWKHVPKAPLPCVNLGEFQSGAVGETVTLGEIEVCQPQAAGAAGAA